MDLDLVGSKLRCSYYCRKWLIRPWNNIKIIITYVTSAVLVKQQYVWSKQKSP